jgi:hypothetical protein
MAPHAWGVARYAVTLDRPGVDPTITLDQTARVESVLVADRLRLTTDNDLTVDQLLTVDPLGALTGAGAIFGNVCNNGAVIPGDAIGSVAIAGAYTQQASGSLTFELGGSAPGLQYDQLLITGAGALAGTLAVDLIDGFTPNIGQTFTILTANEVDGTFTTEMLPSLPGLVFDVVYNPQSVVLTVSPAFTADFNEDGHVDLDDMARWQGDFSVNALSDADNDGDSDGDDFLAWQQQLGSGFPRESASGVIPEPSALALVSLVVCSGALIRLLPRQDIRESLECPRTLPS